MRLNKFKDQVWQKAIDFDYQDHLDTIQFQKVCPWCGDTMIYTEYSPDLNKNALSAHAWTVGYSLPLKRGGSKNLDNLQAIHVRCEFEKENDYTLVFGLDN